MPRAAELSAAAILAALLAACSLRVAAPGELDLAVDVGTEAEELVTLFVDLDVDWIAIECEPLVRRIIVKPARGRVELRGLPPGDCHVRADTLEPCEGTLEAGKDAYLVPFNLSQLFCVEHDNPNSCRFAEHEPRRVWQRDPGRSREPP